jgi:hypothetical protein
LAWVAEHLPSKYEVPELKTPELPKKKKKKEFLILLLPFMTDILKRVHSIYL